MNSFLSPLALLFGLLAVPILILYMLKLRRREVEVSSVMLWQMLLRDREANAPWQRLKRNLLLLLQLLLLAALVIALARPFLRVPTIAAGTVVVLLDASASMNATDVEPNRFEAAKAAARQLMDGLSSDGKMSLLLVGHQPEVLASATNDKDVLRAALGKAHVSEESADWEAAFALASGAVRAASIEHSTVVIISDGGLPSNRNLPPLPGAVRYVPVGASADNLAIEALPEDLRLAIVLRELEGLSYEDIATTMDCPVGTVRSRIFRAREAIDRSLREVFDGGLGRIGDL